MKTFPTTASAVICSRSFINKGWERLLICYFTIFFRIVLQKSSFQSTILCRIQGGPLNRTNFKGALPSSPIFNKSSQDRQRNLIGGWSSIFNRIWHFYLIRWPINQMFKHQTQEKSNLDQNCEKYSTVLKLWPRCKGGIHVTCTPEIWTAIRGSTPRIRNRSLTRPKTSQKIWGPRVCPGEIFVTTPSRLA